MDDPHKVCKTSLRVCVKLFLFRTLRMCVIIFECSFVVQDIVTRHLTEKSVAEEPGSSLGPGSQSELTPSESLATTDNVRETHTHTHIKRDLPKFSFATCAHTHTVVFQISAWSVDVSCVLFSGMILV